MGWCLADNLEPAGNAAAACLVLVDQTRGVDLVAGQPELAITAPTGAYELPVVSSEEEGSFWFKNYLR